MPNISKDMLKLFMSFKNLIAKTNKNPTKLKSSMSTPEKVVKFLKPFTGFGS